MTENKLIIIIVYVLTSIYFALLGAFMLTRQCNLASTHGEQKAKRRMMRSVGIYMLGFAIDWFIYLPAMFIEDFKPGNSYLYDVCFVINLAIETPMLYYVMHTMLQKKVDNIRWTLNIAAQFLVLLICYLVLPTDVCGRIPYHLSAVLTIAFIVQLVCRYINEYRSYIHRIKSEYSDISGREIIWSWSCFAGFALQLLVFIIYDYYWVPILELVYLILSISNTTYLCYCTYRQKPIDIDVVEEEEDTALSPRDGVEDIIPSSPLGVEPRVVSVGQASFYSVIERKLESICEARLLYLEPDLTRETLCHRLGISSTYLKMYFHSRNLSFYQYINTLRVKYACKLMEENPGISIRDVSEQSGFRSQTTFRKMFKEVMGCLPSDIKQKKAP